MAQVVRRSLLVHLPHVANNSPLLQPWCVGPGAMPRRWAPLTRDTRKGIKGV